MSDCIDLMADPTPPSIPGFDSFRYIDSGGFGHMWIGRQSHGDYYAVKVLYPNVEQIEREAVAAMTELRARHVPGLVPIADWGIEPGARGRVWYKMTHADPLAGSIEQQDYEPDTLARRLEHGKFLTPLEVVRLAVGLLNGLAHLHQVGLVHRDVCPANIVRIKQTWQLGDFSTVARRKHMASGDISFDGRPEITPPEGAVDESADLFGLGVTLRYALGMLGKSTPTSASVPAPNSVSAGHAKSGDDDARLVEGLLAVITKACAPREDRYTSTNQMLSDVAALVTPDVSRLVRFGQALARITVKLAIIGAAFFLTAAVVLRYHHHQVATAQYRDVMNTIERTGMAPEHRAAAIHEIASAMIGLRDRWDDAAAVEDFLRLRDCLEDRLIRENTLAGISPESFQHIDGATDYKRSWRKDPDVALPFAKSRKVRQAVIELLHRLGPPDDTEPAGRGGVLQWDGRSAWPTELRSEPCSAAAIDLRYLWQPIGRGDDAPRSRTLDLLNGAHLEGVVMNNARIEGAPLQEAWLIGAELVKARCQGWNADSVDLRYANLREANLCGAHLGRAKLQAAVLKGAFLGNCQLGLAGMQAVVARDADFSLAALTKADLTGATLAGARLVGADLRMAILHGADLTGADLRAADLTGASFDGNTILDRCRFGGWTDDQERSATVRRIEAELADLPMTPQCRKRLIDRLHRQADQSAQTISRNPSSKE